MICYNDLLSHHEIEGEVGRPEYRDDAETLNAKIDKLYEALLDSNQTCFIVGAGISTSSNISDFRGPNGVWTKLKNGEKADPSDIGNAEPTTTHYALRELEDQAHIQWMISQNVDGLFHRSGYPLNLLCEIHGNLFRLQCISCGRMYYNKDPVASVGHKPTTFKCEGTPHGRPCRGILRDTTLDWITPINPDDLKKCEQVIEICDLIVVLGTSLEVNPVGSWPSIAAARGTKIHAVNLQETQYDDPKSANIGSTDP
ncbi:unnamed protein product [Caenorhabditis bovis]|uniref:protein acetyllysine N-acetyltransferase n=1 Tax=Caenorhabditis bovis TaxID=2654633 RepID=A0A8S1EHD8_9PELO|nr:unnamed protein product [Caenorhabditis bovis]